MFDIGKLIYNVVLLFIMMVPGVILKKGKLISDGFGKGISNLVLYIAQPALVFLAYVRAFSKEILINALWVFLFSILAHAIFTVVSMLLFKGAPDARRRMLRFATIFSNAAFMGIPLIEAVCGAEATLYASIYNITFNLFLWSLGVFLCTAHRDVDGDGENDGAEMRKNDGISLTRALIHPVTIAAALGLAVFCVPALSNWLVAGNIVYDSLYMLKALVAPLSMVVIGIRLADIDLRGFFTDKYVYIFLSLRHFVLPIAVVGVLRAFSLLVPIASEVITVVAILAATPAASSASMFAEKYDCDAIYASKLVAVSTILSILSMPLVMLLVTL